LTHHSSLVNFEFHPETLHNAHLWPFELSGIVHFLVMISAVALFWDRNSNCTNIGSSMVCDVIWFLSNELCVSIPEPWRGDRKHTTSCIKIILHHKAWEILFITYLPSHTCFCYFYSSNGVGIHNVTSENYHTSDITLISRKICDNKG
jgi:hypothetical protein